jgi:hypothetical protein
MSLKAIARLTTTLGEGTKCDAAAFTVLAVRR